MWVYVHQDLVSVACSSSASSRPVFVFGGSISLTRTLFNSSRSAHCKAFIHWWCFILNSVERTALPHVHFNRSLTNRKTDRKKEVIIMFGFLQRSVAIVTKQLEWRFFSFLSLWPKHLNGAAVGMVMTCFGMLVANYEIIYHEILYRRSLFPDNKSW